MVGDEHEENTLPVQPPTRDEHEEDTQATISAEHLAGGEDGMVPAPTPTLTSAAGDEDNNGEDTTCLLYTSPSPRD